MTALWLLAIPVVIFVALAFIVPIIKAEDRLSERWWGLAGRSVAVPAATSGDSPMTRFLDWLFGRKPTLAEIPHASRMLCIGIGAATHRSAMR